MSLQFILGGSGSGKSHYVYQNMIERAKKDNRNYLILVPDQFTMQTQKDLCTFPNNDREGIMNIDVLSFSRLSHRIMEEVGEEGGIMLDDTGKNLILRRVAGEHREQLTVIGSHLKKIGYVHEIKSMLSEFYQYDIGTEELEDLIAFSKKKGALSYKLQDLQILREAFAEYIRGKYITTEELLERLCEILPKSDIVKDSVIVLDSFTGFTPIQNKLIRQLLCLAGEVIVTLVADSVEDVKGSEKDSAMNQGEEQLFYLSRHTYETLTRIAKEEQVEILGDIVIPRTEGGNGLVKRYEKNPELGFLEKNLFREQSGSYQGEMQHIYLAEAMNPKKEIQAMLLQIRNLVREEGYAYRDIAVVTGDMSGYEHLFKTEFEYYGVPLYMDQTRGILFHPLSEFLRSMMEMFLNDFSIESVLRFLRTSLTDMSREEIDRFELYIERYGIRGRKRYEKLFTKGADIYETEELAAINNSRQKLMDLLAPVLALNVEKGLMAEKMVQAIYDICVSAKLQDKMEAYRLQFEEKGEMAKAREYAQVYKAVVDLFDQMYALLSGEEMELNEFVQILEAGLSEITIGTIPQNVDQVVAGDIERTRLRPVKALFFIGVNDGAVPKGSKGGGLLSDMEREFLRGAGHELAPTPRQQIFMQRLYLYLNMTKPSEKLYLSYSRVDNEGKTLRKSYLVGVMRRLFPKLIVTNVSMLPPLNLIATKRDGLDDLAVMFSQYAEGKLEQNRKEKDAFLALLDAYLKEQGEEIISQFLEAAFYQYEPKKLPAALAQALYGDIVESSVGRLEQFSACAYAHFLKYGMRLKEDAEFEVSSADVGNLYHEVMKRFAEFLKERGYHWTDFPLNEADAFIEQLMEKLSKEYENALFYSSEESLYAISDMTAILKRTIHTLRYQMAKGLFTPKSFEVPFYLGDKIKAKGRIDRIDTFEKDGEVYVKVVDYKSGKNEFDPVEFYFGLKMQLAVYMKAAVALEEEKQTDKHVIPAALVYYQFQNPYVEEEGGDLTGADGTVSEEALERKIREKMKMTGLVSEDDAVILALDKEFETESDVMPVKRKKDGSFYKNSITGTREQLELLMDYVDYKIEEVGKRVYAGEIEINPYKKKDKNACQYCTFKGICHFDEKIEGYRMRQLDQTDADLAWQEIARVLGKEKESGN